MFLESLAFILSAGTTLYLKIVFKKKRKSPRLGNVLRALRKITPWQPYTDPLTERIVEEYLMFRLGKYFKDIQRQSVVKGIPHNRDRVDLDIGNGAFGIEIKMAKLLKKSNERNRLLGQLDLYKERKYSHNNLLLVVVGQKEGEEEHHIAEIKKILENKKIPLFYLALV